MNKAFHGLIISEGRGEAEDFRSDVKKVNETVICYFGAPVHIVTGSASCDEGRDHFRHTPFHWSAFRSQDYGYTRFKAYNKTHINIEQVSVDLGGQVIDTFWLKKNLSISSHP